MSTTPRTVGRYEVLRELGRGGMATVHLARQVDLGRQIALKELSALSLRDAELAGRFVHEARLVGSLSHPNIVHVYEFFESGGAAYIAMEYLASGSLRPWVRTLSTAQAAGVLEGVLAGLEHAAAHGVVHRDIKPENVLITEEGAVKVSDFGIAKAVEQLTDISLTAAGQAVGTPAYMAPEQAMAGDVTPQTDLYAVGVMAYELFSGRLPYSSEGSTMAVLMRHVNDEPTPLAQAAPALDPRLAAWTHRMLAKRPADRPAGARAAWEELEEIVLDVCGPRWRRTARLCEVPGAGAGAGAAAAPTPTRAGTPASDSTPTRGPRAAEATGVLAAGAPAAPITAGLAAPAPAAGGRPPDDPAAPGAASSTLRRRRLLAAGLALVLVAGAATAAALSLGGGSDQDPADVTQAGAIASLRDLVADNAGLSYALQRLRPRAQPGAARARVGLAMNQRLAAVHVVGALTPANAADRRLDRVARATLDAEKGYLRAVDAALRRVASRAQRARLQPLADALVTRLKALDASIPGASDSVHGTRELQAWAAGPAPRGLAAPSHTGTTTPPPPAGVPGKLVLTVPSGISAASPDGGRVSVTFPVSAHLDSRSVPVSCSPASGSEFAPGTTTVTCSASTGGQTRSRSFPVTVTGPTPPPTTTTPTTTVPPPTTTVPPPTTTVSTAASG